MGFLWTIILAILKKFAQLIESSLPPQLRDGLDFFQKLKRGPFKFLSKEKESPKKNKLMQKILEILKKYFKKAIKYLAKIAASCGDVLLIVLAVALIGVMLSAILGAFGAFNGRITIEFDKFEELNSDESIYMDAQNTNELRKAYMQLVSEGSYYQMFNLTDINPASGNPFVKTMAKLSNKIHQWTGWGSPINEEDVNYLSMPRSIIGWLSQDERYIYSDANKNALKYLKMPHVIGIDDDLGDITRDLNEVDDFFRDYYNREKTFQLSETLLSEMNRILFGEFSNAESITYPEAFTKPVSFVDDYYRIQDDKDDISFGLPYVYMTQRVTRDDILNSSSEFYEKDWLEGIIKSTPSHVIYDYAIKEKNTYFWSDSSGDLQTQMSWGNVGGYVSKKIIEELDDGTEVEKEELIKLYWRVKDTDISANNDSKVTYKISGKEISVNPYNEHMGNYIYNEKTELYGGIGLENYDKYFDGPYLNINIQGDKITFSDSDRVCKKDDKGNFIDAYFYVDGVKVSCADNAYPMKHKQLVSIFDDYGEMQVNSRVLFNKNFVQKKSVRDSYRYFPEYFSNFTNFAETDLARCSPEMGLELFASSDNEMTGDCSCDDKDYKNDEKLPFSERKCSIIRRHTGTNGWAYVKAKFTEWGQGISNFFTGEDKEAEINVSSQAMFYLLLAYDDYIIETGEYGIAWDYKYYTATQLDMSLAKAQYMDIYGFKEIFVDSWNDTAVYKQTLNTVKALDSSRSLSTTYVPVATISGQQAKEEDAGKNNANNLGYGWRIASNSSGLQIAGSYNSQSLERVAGEASLELPSYSVYGSGGIWQQLKDYVTNSIHYGSGDFRYHYDANGDITDIPLSESWDSYLQKAGNGLKDKSLVDSFLLSMKTYNEGGDWRNTTEAWNPNANTYRPTYSSSISKTIDCVPDLSKNKTCITETTEGRVTYQSGKDDYLPYEVKSVRDYGLGSVLSYIQDFRVVYQTGVFMDEIFTKDGVKKWFDGKTIKVLIDGKKVNKKASELFSKYVNGFYPRQLLDEVYSSETLFDAMRKTPVSVDELQKIAQSVVTLQHAATDYEKEYAFELVCKDKGGTVSSGGSGSGGGLCKKGGGVINISQDDVRKMLMIVIANRNLDGVYISPLTEVVEGNNVKAGEAFEAWHLTNQKQTDKNITANTTNMCANAESKCNFSSEEDKYSDSRLKCLENKEKQGFYFNDGKFECEKRCYNNYVNAIDAIHPDFNDEEKAEKEAIIATEKSNCMTICEADYKDINAVCDSSIPDKEEILNTIHIYSPYLTDTFWEGLANSVKDSPLGHLVSWIATGDTDATKTFDQVQYLDPLQYYIEWFDFKSDSESSSLITRALTFLSGAELKSEIVTGVSAELQKARDTGATGFKKDWNVRDTWWITSIPEDYFGTAGTKLTEKFRTDFFNQYRQNIEPMRLILENESYRVYMIDEAVTFLGTFTYTYTNDIANVGTGNTQKQIIGLAYADRYYFMDNYIFSVPLLEFKPRHLEDWESKSCKTDGCAYELMDKAPTAEEKAKDDAKGAVWYNPFTWGEKPLEIIDYAKQCRVVVEECWNECSKYEDITLTLQDGSVVVIGQRCVERNGPHHHSEYAVCEYVTVTSDTAENSIKGIHIDTRDEVEKLMNQLGKGSETSDRIDIGMKVYEDLDKWSWSTKNNSVSDFKTAFTHEYSQYIPENGDDDNHYGDYKDVAANIQGRSGYLVDRDIDSPIVNGYTNDVQMDIDFNLGLQKPNVLEAEDMTKILSAVKVAWSEREKLISRCYNIFSGSWISYSSPRMCESNGFSWLTTGQKIADDPEAIGVGLLVADRKDHGYPIPFFRHYAGVTREILPRQKGYYFNGEVFDSWNSRLILREDMTPTQVKNITEEKDKLQSYLYDYIMNFEAYVPLDVKSDYDLMSRARTPYHNMMISSTSHTTTTATLSNNIMSLAVSEETKQTFARYGLEDASVAQLISGLIEVSVDRSGLHTIKSLNSTITSGAKIEESNENINTIKNMVLRTIGGGNTSLDGGGTGGSVNFGGTLFLGDSLTNGLSNANNLSSKGAKIDAVDSRGISATTTSAAKHSGYNVVFINIGMNNIAYDNATFTQHYKNLIETVAIKNPNAIIYLGSVPGINEQKAKTYGYTSFGNAEIREKNAIIEELAVMNNLKFMDVNSYLGDIQASDTTDGLHLTKAMYQKWFTLIESTLNSYGNAFSGNAGLNVNLKMDDGTFQSFRLPEVGPGMIFYLYENKEDSISTSSYGGNQVCDGSIGGYSKCYTDVSLQVGPNIDERLDLKASLDFVNVKFGKLVRKFGNVKYGIMAYFYGEKYTQAMIDLAQENGWGESWLNGNDKQKIAQAIHRSTGNTEVLNKAEDINEFMYDATVVEKVMSYIQSTEDKIVANNKSTIPANVSGVTIGNNAEHGRNLYNKWGGLIDKYCAKYEVDVAFAVAIFMQESSGNSFAGICGGDSISTYEDLNIRQCVNLNTNRYNGGGGLGQIHAPGLGDNGCNAVGATTCTKTVKSAVNGDVVVLKMADPKYWIRGIESFDSYLQKDDRYGNAELSIQASIIIMSNHLKTYGGDAFKAAVAYNGVPSGISLKNDENWYDAYAARKNEDTNYVTNVFQFYDQGLATKELNMNSVSSRNSFTGSIFGLDIGNLSYQKDLFLVQNSGVELYKPKMTTSRDDVTTLILNVSNFGKDEYYLYAKEHGVLSLFANREEQEAAMGINNGWIGANAQITSLGEQISADKVPASYRFAYVAPVIPMNSPMGGDIKDQRVTSPFGNRKNIVNGVQVEDIDMHHGVDFGVVSGTPLFATAPGRVLISQYNSSYGNYVKIKHDPPPGTVITSTDGKQYEIQEVYTIYAHMTSLSVKVGDVISNDCSQYEGTGKCIPMTSQIGFSGSTGNSTGPHLHFEVRIKVKDLSSGNTSTEYCDPYYWLTTQWASGDGSVGSGAGYSSAAINAIVSKANSESTLTPERKAVLENALSIVGKVKYFWGGGHEESAYIGENPDWGQSRMVTLDGHSTTNKYMPYGLDAPGFTRWVAANSLGSDVFADNVSIQEQWNLASSDGGAINVASPKPGDFAVDRTMKHIGIYLYTNEDGQKIYVHCSANGVEVGAYSGFTKFFTPPGLK